MIKAAQWENVKLLPGLFEKRAAVNHDYLMELKDVGLLQNFHLEAGIELPGKGRASDPTETDQHWGWESPTCQVRGHFLGHWMSAAAMLVLTQKDPMLKVRLEHIVDELDRCRILNGGKWVASIPEKFLGKLERGESIWSPQYVVHKTLMGLYHAALYAGVEKAVTLTGHMADWFLAWTGQLENPQVIERGEACGMLETWAGLYELTQDERYRTLAERYGQISFFDMLDQLPDALTRHHANGSIPWAHGAAKMYEITGDPKWLQRVQRFWDCAVHQREAFCTGSQNTGEFWVAPGMTSAVLGDRTQEFCTVYNMALLADYLFRFTGEKEYADFIELCLYNGFLAQNHKESGMPTYFLPLGPGSRKKWGSKTCDFWCCHGTMVQAQTRYPSLCYYHSEDAQRLIVSQYIPSEYQWNQAGSHVWISQKTHMKTYVDDVLFDDQDDGWLSRWQLRFTVKCEQAVRFTIALRVPGWCKSVPKILINDQAVSDPVIENGYLILEREWTEDTIQLCFPVSLSLHPLKNEPDLAAVMEGPIVLAGLCDSDCGLFMEQNDPASALTVHTQRIYSTLPWQQSTYRTIRQPVNFLMVPLYDVTDERYTVYFTLRNRKAETSGE